MPHPQIAFASPAPLRYPASVSKTALGFFSSLSCAAICGPLGSYVGHAFTAAISAVVPGIGGELDSAITGTVTSFFGGIANKKGQAAWDAFFKSEDHFNHHFRRALAQALGDSLAAVRDEILGNARFRNKIDALAGVLDCWQTHLAAAAKAATDKGRQALAGLFAGNDHSLATQIRLHQPVSDLQSWVDFYDQRLGRLATDHLGPGMVNTIRDLRDIVCPLLARELPAKFGNVVKDTTHGPAWIAFQRLLLESTRSAISSLAAEQRAAFAALDARLDSILQPGALASLSTSIATLLAAIEPRLVDLQRGVGEIITGNAALLALATEQGRTLDLLLPAVVRTERNTEFILDQNRALHAAIAELSKTIATLTGGSPEKLALEYDTALRLVASRHHLDPAKLHERLEAIADRTLRDEHTAPLQKVRALREAGRFIEARDFALEAAEHLGRIRHQAASEEIALLHEAVDSEITLGHYPAALAHAREAARLADQERDFHEWSRAQIELGRALALGRCDTEAISHHRHLIPLLVDKLGPEHPDTLASRNNLAEALREQGNHAGAEAEHRAVLDIRQRVLGAEHPDTLASRNNLASALYDQGKYAGAEAEHRAVLAIRQRVLGPEHPEVAKSAFNLSLCLQAQGRKRDALEFARRALAILRKALGEEHPNTRKAKQLVEQLGEG